MLKQLGPILALGTAAEIAWLWSYRIGPLRDAPWSFLGLLAAQFGIMLWAFMKVPITPGPRVWLMLGFAVIFRATLLPAIPYQSEDVYRYLWDARVAASGVSPFRYAPNAPELAALREGPLYARLNSKPYITAYPPVSQFLFRLAYGLFGENATGIKVLFSTFELAALLLAWRLAVSWRCKLAGLFLVAWNPLFIFEFSHSGHSDSAMLFFALLALYLLERRRAGAAMASYALAVLSKLHPALWFPLLARRVGARAALVGAGTGLGFGAIYFAGEPAFDYVHSLRLYYRLFEFNAGVHYLLRWVGRELCGEAWDQRTGPYLAAALLTIAALIWWRFPARTGRDLIHGFFWLMVADLVLSTTVHPWYLAWAAFALPFYPYLFMVYWTGAALLSYLAYSYRPVYEPGWVLMVEYVPMFALMAWELALGRPLLARAEQSETTGYGARPFGSGTGS